MKICTSCGTGRSDEEFSLRASASDGLKPTCKMCDSIEYNTRKAAGKVKNTRSNHPEIFKAKYGISDSTIRAYVNRNYSFLWGELTDSEKDSMVEEYKQFRGRKRVSRGYKVRL